MQTVNVTCGRCGRLMAVGQEFLGQQVRCPHCQEVVITPTPEAGPADAPPVANMADITITPPPVEPDSIFSPPEADGEDILVSPSSPQVVIPSEPVVPSSGDPWPSFAVAGPVEGPPSAVPAPEPVPESVPTFTEQPPPAPALAPTVALTPSAPDEPAAAPGAPAEPAADAAQVVIPPSLPRRAGSGGWVIALVIIPLISYSVLATIAVMILYTRQQQQSHPLEMIPDIEGDNKGAKRQRTPATVKMPRVDEPLPPRLCVGLGQTIRVGDLEVTPTRVELRKVWIATEGYRVVEQMPDESLVLHLHLRNVSADVVFKPLDRCFDRQWKEGKSAGVRAPYTYLELLQDGRRFYGGPIPWAPAGSRNPPPRETVILKEKDREIRQNYGKELGPGEEMDTFLCTDHLDQVARALEAYHGPLRWRVHLRRGLVVVRDRDVSATAVIGVDFTDQDIQRPRAAAPG
ncbi:MAG TPA: hypothetical protein VNK04_15440 [Gemmataceae bacterium]|nr:hypothetical protein [Gemmataceae bacterium]